jgi:glutathione S-transferase
VIDLRLPFRYLSDKYDKENRLLPAIGDPKRYKVLQWVHASEATYLLHGLAILYAKWNQKDGDVEKTVAGLSANMIKDLDYLERELGNGNGKFIIGDSLTAADIMMQFSVDFVLVRELGTKGKSWPNIDKWLKNCSSTPSYQAAVEKTGYKL